MAVDLQGVCPNPGVSESLQSIPQIRRCHFNYENYCRDPTSSCNASQPHLEQNPVHTQEGHWGQTCVFRLQDFTRPVPHLHCGPQHRWTCLYGDNFKLSRLYLCIRSPIYQHAVLATWPIKITLQLNISSPQMSSHFQILLFHQCLERKINSEIEMSTGRETTDFSIFTRCYSSPGNSQRCLALGHAYLSPKLNFNVSKLFGLKDSESC